MIATIIILCMYALDLGVTLANHGKPKDVNYNVWITLIADGLMVMLLYWAGLFENFR